MMNKLFLAGLVLLMLFSAFFFWPRENTQIKMPKPVLHEKNNITAHEMVSQHLVSIHSGGESAVQQSEVKNKKSAGSSVQPKESKPDSNPANNLENNFALSSSIKNSANSRPQVDTTVQPSSAAVIPSSSFANAANENELELHQETPSADEEYSQSEDEKKVPQILSGWVFDEAGKAVSGISVEATARYSSGSRQRASTDSEGFFEFSQLKDSAYYVRTRATDRYESASATLQAGTQTAVLVVREKTDSSLTVHGIVESVSGEVLADVRVEPTGQARQSTSTDAQGRYSLQLSLDRQNEQITLRYLLDGYQEGQFRLIGQQLVGVRETEASVRLEPAAEQVPVVGTVQGSNGQPIKWASVHLYSASSKQNAQAMTDAGGRFALADITTGDDYRLWVHSKEDWSDYVEENLLVSSGGANLSIVLDPLEYGSLSGWMVDAEGRAVPNFKLWVRTDQESAGHPDSVTGDSSGHFTLNDLPEGGVTLQTRSAPDFTFSGIKVASGGTTEARLIFDTGDCKLEGFVLDSQGERLPLAKVRLTWSMNQDGTLSRSSRETVTDAAGYFLFMNLGAGSHELSISKDDYRPVRQDAAVNSESKAIVLRLAKNAKNTLQQP